MTNQTQSQSHPAAQKRNGAAAEQAQQQQQQPHKRAPAMAAGEGEEEKHILADRYKTKLCKNFVAKGACPYEVRCMFAHGEEEVRTSEDNIRDGLITEEAIKAFQRQQNQAKRRTGFGAATPAATRDHHSNSHAHAVRHAPVAAAATEPQRPIYELEEVVSENGEVFRSHHHNHHNLRVRQPETSSQQQQQQQSAFPQSHHQRHVQHRHVQQQQQQQQPSVHYASQPQSQSQSQSLSLSQPQPQLGQDLQLQSTMTTYFTHNPYAYDLIPAAARIFPVYRAPVEAETMVDGYWYAEEEPVQEEYFFPSSDMMMPLVPSSVTQQAPQPQYPHYGKAHELHASSSGFSNDEAAYGHHESAGGVVYRPMAKCVAAEMPSDADLPAMVMEP